MRTSLYAAATLASIVSLGACVDGITAVNDRSVPDGLVMTDSTAVPPDTGIVVDSTVTDTAAAPVPLVLLSPAEGAYLPQNDSTIGCPYHAYRGYGFQVEFDWADADSALGPVAYFIHVQKAGALYPIISGDVYESRTTFSSCNGFVADHNLTGWRWYVLAHDGRGHVVAASDTSWFGFEPCRHPDGRACTAPQGSGPPAMLGAGID